MDAMTELNWLAETSHGWALFVLATGCLVSLIALAYGILHWMDRRQSPPTSRKITIQMPLGSDEKLIRLEQRLSQRHLEILQTEWHCDFAHDRESVTFRVAVPHTSSRTHYPRQKTA